MRPLPPRLLAAAGVALLVAAIGIGSWSWQARAASEPAPEAPASAADTSPLAGASSVTGAGEELAARPGALSSLS
jgi:hypothetical protein